MSLEELRARLDNLLARHTRSADRQVRMAGLRDALVELKVALSQSRQALAGAESELAVERQRLADAERRGRLAQEIADAETVRIAGEFSAKHRERVDLLERKIVVIRDEVAFAEREYTELSEQYRSARLGTDAPGPAAGAAAAGALDDELTGDLDRLGREQERAAREEAVKAQLEYLKKKLGRRE